MPMSVSTPRRRSPSPITYWTGSRASCGTVTGWISSAPMAKRSWLSKP
jgi:hypothetical protein